MENYINNLKIAVINKDLKKLEQIIEKEPVFSSVDEAKEIQSYLKLAVNILEKEKSKLSNEMQKIKQLKKFNTEKNDAKKIDFKI
jgi:nitrogenase subunit NifH